MSWGASSPVITSITSKLRACSRVAFANSEELRKLKRTDGAPTMHTSHMPVITASHPQRWTLLQLCDDGVVACAGIHVRRTATGIAAGSTPWRRAAKGADASAGIRGHGHGGKWRERPRLRPSDRVRSHPDPRDQRDARDNDRRHGMRLRLGARVLRVCLPSAVQNQIRGRLGAELRRGAHDLFRRHIGKFLPGRT